jgi:integrase
MSLEELDEYLAEVTTEQRQLRRAHGCADFDSVADVVEGFLEAEQLKCPRESDTFKALSKAVMQSQLRALRGIVERVDGEVVPTPSAPPPLRSEDDLDDLNRALEHWVEKARPGTKTLLEVRPVWQRLQSFTGKSRLSTLTREDVLAFQANELSRTRGGVRVRPQTVNKHLALLGAIARLVHDDLLRFRGVENAFAHLRKAKVRGNDRIDKQDLTTEELTLLFSGPVHAQGDRPLGGAGEAGYWMPVLGYATGARMGELAQMRVDEVMQRDGVWCLWLTSRSEEGEKPAESLEPSERERLLLRSMKTGQSRRIVPVHPRVIELGFLNYVEQLRKQKVVRLFPFIKPDCKGSIAGNFSKWYNGYLKKVRIKRRGLDWTSFRHTLKSACRVNGISSDLQDYIEGHQSTRTAQDYGTFPPVMLQKAISLIALPGLAGVPEWQASGLPSKGPRT